MQALTIRKAKKEDVALVANLSWQTFFDTYAQYNSKEDMESFLTSNFSKDVVAKEIENKKNIFLLAYLKREIVGYVKLSENKIPGEPSEIEAIEIARFYSIKNKIGSGVGKHLMQQCIDIAKSKSKAVLWLCVWSQNHRAIQFYRKFGFEKFGDFTFMLGNDAQDDWLMKLNVNEL